MKSNVNVNLVWAMARNRVIGRDNQLPWSLPNDLAYFKKITWGHPILMGRKTFESIGRPLPGRRNMVLTRQVGWSSEGVEVFTSLDAVFKELCETSTAAELMVIGGEEIYRQCLPIADTLYATLVHDEVEGDAYFPEFNWKSWCEVQREDHESSERNPHAYSFVVYKQKT